MKAGHVYDVAPEPLVRANTTFYAAGPIEIGIETRHITPESMRESYRDDPTALAAFEATLAAGGGAAFDDGGLSVHVIDATSGHEYLRFDCFDEDPHYHYNHRTDPEGPAKNRWIRFDDAANGPMLPWVHRALTTRLAAMLADADAPDLAARVDQDAVNRAIDGIPELRAVRA